MNHREEAMLTAIKAVFADGYCDEPRLLGLDPEANVLVCSMCGSDGFIGGVFTHHDTCSVGLVRGVMEAVVWNEERRC